ncbi:MAG: hypothetical protein OXF88_22000 [Rhodobacteraceae bacterium]|nr:hypothetical protein [Paracoccaceae bacterium]
MLAKDRSVLEIAAVTGWQARHVRQLSKRIHKKEGVSCQVYLVPRVLALDALPGTERLPARRAVFAVVSPFSTRFPVFPFLASLRHCARD